MTPLITLLLGAVIIGYLWEHARGFFWLLFWVFFGVPGIVAFALAAADNDSLYILVKGIVCEVIPMIFHDLVVVPLQRLFD